jgi:hypothetical protein
MSSAQDTPATLESDAPVCSNPDETLCLEYNPNAAASQLPVNGLAKKFDELGPMVINSDGTISRITNWASLSPQEQSTTFRLISKRNEQRRQQLLDRGVDIKIANSDL